MEHIWILEVATSTGKEVVDVEILPFGIARISILDAWQDSPRMMIKCISGTLIIHVMTNQSMNK
jgi:hypothetical protein